LPQPFADARALFALTDYRRVWVIGGLTGIGRWLEFVATAIFVYQLSGSPKLVALLAVLRMLPYIVLGFLMGALADAINRKHLLVASLIAMIATSTFMVALTAAGAATYAAIAAAVMASGAFWTTDMPVRRRLLVDAVDGGRVAAALGFDNSTMYATRALGPALGGATYQFLGISGIYALIAASFVICLWLALRIDASREHPPAITPAWASLRLLLPPRDLIQDRRFQIIMGVTLVYNLWCFPFVTMVPVIASRDFALTPTLVGALSACDGLGGTIGGMAVGMLAAQRTLFRFYYLGALAFALLVLALSLHLTVSTAIGVLVLIGMAAASYSSTQYALVYTMAAPDMRGRATGMLSIFIGSSMLGHYHTGLLFERLGSARAMQVMAAEGIAVMIVLAMLWRRASARDNR
jgi:predicted MFS family arabinose efflux permease